MSHNKVTIIGAGMVGSTAAYSLIAAHFIEEIALLDINKKYLNSQVMDLQHSIPFLGGTRIKCGTYKDIKDSAIVVVTCGAKQKPGQTRLDLVKQNACIVANIIPKVFANNPNAVLIIVANPVDILTYVSVRMFPQHRKRIIGSGTILDSARFRFLLGQELKVNPQSIHAYIIGEHGDSEVPVWSSATIGGISIFRYKKLSAKKKKKIFLQAKNAAYAIIEGKQSTYYAIAAGIVEIVRTILLDKRKVLPVSHMLNGECGIKDVCLSLPVILGKEGIVDTIGLQLSAGEKKQLCKSASKLKQITEELNLKKI